MSWSKVHSTKIMDPDQMEGSQRMEVEGGHKRDEQLVEEGGVAHRSQKPGRKNICFCVGLVGITWGKDLERLK